MMKITQRQLEGILITEGIISASSIEDPYGYDGGRTELAMTIATQRINELLSTGPPAREAGPVGRNDPVRGKDFMDKSTLQR
jgi:hypothetical protein